MNINQLTSEKIASLYHNACLAELEALKPGNVHAFSDGHGMTVHDFIKSADASADVIAKPGLSVGERIFYSVEATQNAVGMNTNLGIILLCAPLIHTSLTNGANNTFHNSLSATLNNLTESDSLLVSRAILLANPAGLGNPSENNVHERPSVALLEMMRSAQDKDRIAWQYANLYQDIFDFGISRYRKSITKWQNQAWAITALYLGFVARQLDTHVVRKYGESLANSVMIEARDIEIAYLNTDNPKLIQRKLLDWDFSLKSRKINPGTSADLTVATMLAIFLT